MKKVELVFDRLSVDWTPEEDEAFNEVERQSNLGKHILQEIKPKREWVPLTKEDIAHLGIHTTDTYPEEFIRYVEARCREKNT